MSDKAISVGVHNGKVMIAIENTPVAAFDAPQAAAFAALLIKHACVLSSGLSPSAVVKEAADQVYDRKAPNRG